MTKRHQQFIRAARPELIGRSPEQKGEFTVVVGPVQAIEAAHATVPDSEIFAEFGRTTDIPGGRRAVVSLLAHKYGRSAKDVYSIIERLKKSGVPDA
jgi:hypothetical protein